MGVTVPQVRQCIREFRNLSLPQIRLLLQDPLHECRLAGLLILVHAYRQEEGGTKKRFVDFYIQHVHAVNNWDLVDSSAPQILGDYLRNRSRSILWSFARSGSLWKERISVVATHAFILQNDHQETLKLCKHFLSHPHDLMHKACGWMLREVGKKDINVLNQFLAEHAATMPRTMLRYAIENHSKPQRMQYMRMRQNS